MIGTTLSQYKIREKLGEGGVGIAYKVPTFPANEVSGWSVEDPAVLLSRTQGSSL